MYNVLLQIGISIITTALFLIGYIKYEEKVRPKYATLSLVDLVKKEQQLYILNKISKEEFERRLKRYRKFIDEVLPDKGYIVIEKRAIIKYDESLVEDFTKKAIEYARE